MLQYKIARSGTDALKLLPLLSDLHASSVYKDMAEFNPDDVLKTIEVLQKKPEDEVIIITLVDENDIPQGVLAAGHMDPLFNHSARTAIEIAFWLNPGYRTHSNKKQLLQAYKYWAKLVGCKTYIVGKFVDQGKPETYSIRKL